MVDVHAAQRFLLRLRLVDRPGALGVVAGRIGAVRGDLVGIDILERSAGEAVDELVVELPSPDLLALLVRELGEVEDIIVVEQAVPLADVDHDPTLAAFDVAAVLVGAETTDELFWSLCSHIRRTVSTDWACIVDASGLPLAHAGAMPDEARLSAVVSSSGGVGSQPVVTEQMLDGDHLSWLPLPAASAALILGRSSTPLRAVERRRAAAFTRVAGTWYGRLKERSRLRSLMAHPSGGNQHVGSPATVPDDVSSLVDQG
ncbi:MAG: hypothetical protein AAGD35_07780 [Actinomycetota bacterium]